MDIIRLLPDMVANQIAAGEVIQRPASAVKELMENAIDAGATEIVVVIKDAGKTLIQVTDNGCGMSEADARLCFERHATSKIREAQDLYSIRTMGFRGEALASIASIAQVELKTRRREDEVGNLVLIEGSVIKSQEPCPCDYGTSILVKNVFFNVPARRNFLKADSTELSYIIEEFQRVALVHPEISFSLHSNGKQLFKVSQGTSRQRIVALFGNPYTERLVQVETESNIVNISGFIVKPEFAKRTRGEQYFFANQRFIKHPYLHHAVANAFQDLIPENTFPSYFIFLDVDPKTIDINIHPTKTEVKFEDERSLYAILRSSVKQALGKFSLTPSLDFDIERSMDFPEIRPGEAVKVPQVKTNPYFNPFDKESSGPLPGKPVRMSPQQGLEQWSKLYPQEEKAVPELTPVQNDELFPQTTIHSSLDEVPAEPAGSKYFQVNGRYILTQLKTGLMVIHQQFAHERVLYERNLQQQRAGSSNSQQLLFPQTITFSPADAGLFASILSDVCASGFDIADIGGGSFIVNGVPADFGDNPTQVILEQVLESYKDNLQHMNGNNRNRLAAAFARQMAVKPGKYLSEEEMRFLVELLFACSSPDKTPDGKKTFHIISYEELSRTFK